MSTYNFTDKLGANSSIDAIKTDDGGVMLYMNTYPMSAMYSMPMDVAIKVATDILQIANAQMKEAA